MKHLSATFLTIAAIAAVPAQASDDWLSLGQFDTPFLIEGGINLMYPSGRFGAFTPDGSTGGFIDLSDLNFDKNALTPLLTARWRVSERWQLAALYQSVGISGRITGSTGLEFPPITIPVGYDIGSDLDVTRGRVSAGYAFWTSGRYEYGLGAEYNVIRFKTTVQGTLQSVGATAPVNTSVSDTYNVPALFAFGTHALGPVLSVDGRIAGISGDLGSISGDFVSLEAKLNYHLSDQWAAAVGAQYIKADFTFAATDRNLVYDLEFPGLFLTLAAHF